MGKRLWLADKLNLKTNCNRVGSGVSSGYNLAVAGATSRQLLGQARRLVAAMRSDPNLDFKRDWKMITILVRNASFQLNIV